MDTPAPAAIIFSLEGVFATIAAWFILNQILDVNNLLGCFFILCVVRYSSSEGTEECKKAIINSIAAEIPNKNIYDLDCVITDGPTHQLIRGL